MDVPGIAVIAGFDEPRISARAPDRSSNEAVKPYGAKPTKATRILLARTTVICPGRPVCAMCAASSESTVCCWPAAPKSYEWLFALFRTVKPALARSLAYDGGTRNA